MAGMADKLQASRKSQMEAFTTLFFAVGGALNFVRYGLWVLFPLATLVLLLARFSKSGVDSGLLRFAWWSSVVFLILVGGLLVSGLLAASQDRYFYYPVFQLLFVVGPAPLACLVSLFLRPVASS